MSFLNPVNEPVLRFKSTDAGAPQINYNARVAGDVKAVLKACLVTGYGAVASAGWTAVNEVGNVIEFVSPSAAMSDYRLGIDDSTATKTDWYYRYQDVRTNPSYNAPTKTFFLADKAHTSNGWQLLVTQRGFVFIELIYLTVVSKISARMTYFGRVKSGLVDTSGANMMFFNIGHSASIAMPSDLYQTTYPHLQLNRFTAPQLLSATPFALGQQTYFFGLSALDVASAIYIAVTGKDVVIAELVGILTKVVNLAADTYGVSDTQINTRPVLSVCCGYASESSLSAQQNSRTFLIYLDYWEY